MNVLAPDLAEDILVRTSTSGMCRRGPNQDQESWDRLLQELGGQFHQSWRWGEFRKRDGWGVERVVVERGSGTGMAQIMFKRRGPVSTAFVPRGPLIRGEDLQILPAVLAAIAAVSRRHRAIHVNIEPERAIEWDGMTGSSRIVEGGDQYTPGRTVMVPLVDDEALVRQMHSAKRREVRRAERRGITIETLAPTDAPVAAFHALLEDTSTRNQFRINPKSYYADFLRLFEDDAALMLAMVDGKVAAGLIVVRFGEMATYLFGASSTQHRVPGAVAYLHYQTMRWARERGCTRYDLWGIPDTDPEPATGPNQQPLRSLGRDESGLYRFKMELGGEIVTYPAAVEYRFHPGMSWMVRRLKAIDRAVRR